MVERLAPAMSLRAYPEHPEENPFFGPPGHRDFASETWFLADSVATHRAIRDNQGGAVQERSVYEQVPVFARARLRQGWLEQEAFDLLRILQRLLCDGLIPPDLVIFLRADQVSIERRIAKRRRPAEDDIDSSYLQLLGEYYEEFIADWQLCPVYYIDTEQIDLRDEGTLMRVVGDVEASLS